MYMGDPGAFMAAARAAGGAAGGAAGKTGGDAVASLLMTSLVEPGPSGDALTDDDLGKFISASYELTADQDEESEESEEEGWIRWTWNYMTTNLTWLTRGVDTEDQKKEAVRAFVQQARQFKEGEEEKEEKKQEASDAKAAEELQERRARSRAPPPVPSAPAVSAPRVPTTRKRQRRVENVTFAETTEKSAYSLEEVEDETDDDDPEMYDWNGRYLTTDRNDGLVKNYITTLMINLANPLPEPTAELMDHLKAGSIYRKTNKNGVESLHIFCDGIGPRGGHVVSYLQGLPSAKNTTRCKEKRGIQTTALGPSVGKYAWDLVRRHMESKFNLDQKIFQMLIEDNEGYKDWEERHTHVEGTNNETISILHNILIDLNGATTEDIRLQTRIP